MLPGHLPWWLINDRSIGVEKNILHHEFIAADTSALCLAVPRKDEPDDELLTGSFDLDVWNQLVGMDG